MEMNALLEVFGPFEIPYDGKGRRKRIDKEHIQSFWSKSQANKLAQKQGCYLFALKASQGFKPWYIGKATKTFKQECFTPSKANGYNGLLWGGKKGTPVMFFVALAGNRRKIPKLVINDLEKFLIQSAISKNPKILNVQHTKNLPAWGIRGIIRGGKGKASGKSKTFRIMMGL